ncbi:Lariat debranching enzyme [Perkinsela sp. CCAP 1560/4]|nr:Lariat debranching enzyme [Perkinsela sp. CCAP 1560/4]|eukprot:KNH06105.1 Lariat debranching enzyme [Perkinsela sp. CCAP 1560/4]
MYYAVEGCCHGNLDQIYCSIEELQRQRNIKIELLIVCGDFQAIRNADDLNCMAVPDKYRQMGDFVDYYSGRKVAPVLTIFVGGNHEASNHLWELYYGGWVAPKIYFLGFSGCVSYAGLRIAGVSGIYKQADYHAPYDCKLPYNRSSIRSIYHTRECEIEKLLRLEGCATDIFISHDWPVGITDYGNKEELFKVKPFFREDVEKGALGNPHLMKVLKTLKPKFWFAAHLHCKFSASVDHGCCETKFLALDKSERGRNYLQVLCASHISQDEPRVFKYDISWLRIIKDTLTNAPSTIRDRITERFDYNDCEQLLIPSNFKRDVPYGYVSSKGRSNKFLSMESHQTLNFLKLVNCIDTPQYQQDGKPALLKCRKRASCSTEDYNVEIIGQENDLDSLEIVVCQCEGICHCNNPLECT